MGGVGDGDLLLACTGATVTSIPRALTPVDVRGGCDMDLNPGITAVSHCVVALADCLTNLRTGRATGASNAELPMRGGLQANLRKRNP